jgi:hypothetical protein
MNLSRSGRQRKTNSMLAGFDTQQDNTPVQRKKSVKSVKSVKRLETHTYKVGDEVDVTWEKWYPCTVVLLEKGGTYKINDGEQNVSKVEEKFMRLRNSTAKPCPSRKRPAAPSSAKQLKATKAKYNKLPPLSPPEEAALMRRYPYKAMPKNTAAEKKKRKRMQSCCDSARRLQKMKAANIPQKKRRWKEENQMRVDKYNTDHANDDDFTPVTYVGQITVRKYNKDHAKDDGFTPVTSVGEIGDLRWDDCVQKGECPATISKETQAQLDICAAQFGSIKPQTLSKQEAEVVKLQKSVFLLKGRELLRGLEELDAALTLLKNKQTGVAGAGSSGVAEVAEAGSSGVASWGWLADDESCT